MITAGTATIGTRLLNSYGATGVVIDIVRLASDPDHVGLRIATDDGVSNALFPVGAVLVEVAS